MRKQTMTMILGVVFLAVGRTAYAQTNTFPTSGSVGIGTTSPAYPLTVKSAGINQFAAGVLNSNGTQIFGIWNQNDGDATMVLNSTSGTQEIYLDSTGSSYFNGSNVGIGTTSPSATLEVNGNVKLTSGSGASVTFADGTVQSTAYTGVSCGGDFAESVDVTGKPKKYEPGDLLVIDPEHPGDFQEAAQPYSTLVAGIYSTKPGYVGRRLTGPKSPDEVPLALVGIVPTKVTAENGPIHTGDLLVTSSAPGRAMKGTDRSRLTGAVVGKALGSLDSGTGTIEVLVTLQ